MTIMMMMMMMMMMMVINLVLREIFPKKRRDFHYANSICQTDEDKLMDIKAT